MFVRKDITVICLTPIKNEAWILEHFLQCASLWADKIIIADQMSTDGSREIAQRYAKVILIDNDNDRYDEAARTQLLLVEARKIKGPKLLIALDADEFLSGNFMDSKEWAQILNAKEGTIIRFHRINIHPDLKHCWGDGDKFAVGFLDDDGKTSVRQSPIHNIRIPFADSSPQIICREICFLHYQYIDLDRVESKNRWYQCWELLNRPHLHPITLYRNYNAFFAIQQNNITEIKPHWLNNYTKKGISMLSFKKETTYRWEKEIQIYFATYGNKYFSRLGIWQGHLYQDPRSAVEKLLHQYLLLTQPLIRRHFPLGISIRIIDKILKWIF